MSETADSLDRLADQLLVEARGLGGVADSIEPVIARVRRAWEGPAADRLLSELGDRRHEIGTLAATLRSLAARKLEEARRIRAAEAAALTTADPEPIHRVGGVW